MWKGRFQQETAPAVQRFTESISFDWRLYKFDIQGSIAHASALERAGLLTAEELQQIESGLKAIEQEIDEGRFPFRIDLEDVHMNIESALTSRIGSAGAKLHTARSRNDQVALDLRLYLRHETDEVCRRIRTLQRALVGLAEKYQKPDQPTANSTTPTVGRAINQDRLGPEGPKGPMCRTALSCLFTLSPRVCCNLAPPQPAVRRGTGRAVNALAAI